MEGRGQRDRARVTRSASRSSWARSRSRPRRCSPTSSSGAGSSTSSSTPSPSTPQREGETIAQAGRRGAVTIATNMAGRGVDIKLGGSPEGMAQAELRKLGLDARERELRGGAEGARRAIRVADPGRGRRDPRARRPLHLRHRAPRVAPDRQPASRPLRPPGRSRRVALLPLRRGRPDPALRRRPHLQDPRPARPRERGGRGGGARGEDAHRRRSRTPRRRSRSRTS